MFGQHGNQPYLDHILRHYNQFSSLHTAAAEPVFQILPDLPGSEQDSVFGELGHSSSGYSSYVDSPNSNSITQSPSLTQRSISCHFLINTEPEKSHDSHQRVYNKWSRESIYESMNRATPYNAEEKKERIERYRSKRNLRNFNKKIKYECRKTLADSRPRVRGRFTKNYEIQKGSQPCPFADEDEGDDYSFADEDEGDDYSWISILDEDALISTF